MCGMGAVCLDPIGKWKVMHQVEEMDFSLQGVLSCLLHDSANKKYIHGRKADSRLLSELHSSLIQRWR
jgi:hypothetical protein